MEFKRRINILEIAFPDEALLRASLLPALFAGGAVHADLAANLVQKPGNRNAGKGCNRADQIMAAAMSQIRQGVILRQKDNDRARFFRAKRSGKTRSVPCRIGFDPKSVIAQDSGKQLAREELMVGNLRLRMNLFRRLLIELLIFINIPQYLFLKFRHEKRPSFLH